jgi:hypothetical protein
VRKKKSGSLGETAAFFQTDANGVTASNFAEALLGCNHPPFLNLFRWRKRGI